MKLKDYLKESTARYENLKGDSAKVQQDIYAGAKEFYVEVNNKYDMQFKNKKELDKWLKKEKYELIGID